MAAATVVVGLGLVSGLGQEPGLASRTTTPSSAAKPEKRAVAVAVDSGRRRFAAGSAARVQTGEFRYVVAPGDTEVGIAERFHVCVSDVNDGLPAGVDNGAFPTGTNITVALDASHVLQDGSITC